MLGDGPIMLQAKNAKSVDEILEPGNICVENCMFKLRENVTSHNEVALALDGIMLKS